MNSTPTTVTKPARETYRLMMGAAISDPAETGELVQEYPPGTPFSRIQADARRLAHELRGVDVVVDVFCHKEIWERFFAVCYEPGWKVDLDTGIILERPGEKAESDEPELKGSVAAARDHFEHERARRKAAHNRATNRGTKHEKTGAKH